jgi:hypothetical protein
MFHGSETDYTKRNPGIWFHADQPSIHVRITTESNNVRTSEVFNASIIETNKWIHVKQKLKSKVGGFNLWKPIRYNFRWKIR